MSLSDELNAEAAKRESERDTVAAGQPGKAGLNLDKEGDGLEITLPASQKLPDLSDLDGLIRSRGLDPKDWAVGAVRVNEWEALAYGGGPDGEPRVITLHQLRVGLRAKAHLVYPASDIRERKPPSRKPKEGPWLAVVAGDQHAPYEDPDLHKAFLAWLAAENPAEGVLAGDTLDFPSISRFRARKRWNAACQECIEAGFALVSQYRDASPDTIWSKLRGNHDDRIEKRLMEREPDLADIRPAGEEATAFSVRRLLHLDELGIQMIGDEAEEWDRVEYQLRPGVIVRHKPPEREKMWRIGETVLAGHTHRQRITKLHGRWGDIVCAEIGAMASLEGGLGYADEPDWQAGFGTVTTFKDGSSQVELAEWNGETIRWRGREYR